MDPRSAGVIAEFDQPLSSLCCLWIGFFDAIGRMCYSQAGEIVSLFERNAAAQRHFGAAAGKQ